LPNEASHDEDIEMNGGIDGGEWSASRPGRFVSRETAHGAYCIYIFFLVGFLTTLSVSKHNVKLVECYMNNGELERIWKEAVVG
jgi:hypothetical protein